MKPFWSALQPHYITREKLFTRKKQHPTKILTYINKPFILSCMFCPYTAVKKLFSKNAASVVSEQDPLSDNPRDLEALAALRYVATNYMPKKVFSNMRSAQTGNADIKQIKDMKLQERCGDAMHGVYRGFIAQFAALVDKDRLPPEEQDLLKALTVKNKQYVQNMEALKQRLKNNVQWNGHYDDAQKLLTRLAESDKNNGLSESDSRKYNQARREAEEADAEIAQDVRNLEREMAGEAFFFLKGEEGPIPNAVVEAYDAQTLNNVTIYPLSYLIFAEQAAKAFFDTTKISPAYSKVAKRYVGVTDNIIFRAHQIITEVKELQNPVVFAVVNKAYDSLQQRIASLGSLPELSKAVDPHILKKMNLTNEEKHAAACAAFQKKPQRAGTTRPVGGACPLGFGAGPT